MASILINNKRNIEVRATKIPSVMFAIIHRLNVVELRIKKTMARANGPFPKPIPTRRTTTQNVREARAGTTNIPGIPKRYTNGIESIGYTTLGALKYQTLLFSGNKVL